MKRRMILMSAALGLLLAAFPGAAADKAAGSPASGEPSRSVQPVPDGHTEFDVKGDTPGGGESDDDFSDLPGPNGFGHYGPFATIRRALQVRDRFRANGFPNSYQFHNGDGQYVVPRR